MLKWHFADPVFSTQELYSSRLMATQRHFSGKENEENLLCKMKFYLEWTKVIQVGNFDPQKGECYK